MSIIQDQLIIYEWFTLKPTTPSTVRDNINRLVEEIDEQNFTMNIAGDSLVKETISNRLIGLSKIDFNLIIEYMQNIRIISRRVYIISQLKQIVHINFEQLKELNFSYSNLSNIQPLAFINMPLIEHIILAQNFIYDLRIFAKLNNKYLKTLNLGNILNNSPKLEGLDRLNILELKNGWNIYQPRNSFNNYAQMKKLSKLMRQSTSKTINCNYFALTKKYKSNKQNKSFLKSYIGMYGNLHDQSNKQSKNFLISQDWKIQVKSYIKLFKKVKSFKRHIGKMIQINQYIT